VGTFDDFELNYVQNIPGYELPDPRSHGTGQFSCQREFPDFKSQDSQVPDHSS